MITDYQIAKLLGAKDETAEKVQKISNAMAADKTSVTKDLPLDSQLSKWLFAVKAYRYGVTISEKDKGPDATASVNATFKIFELLEQVKEEEEGHIQITVVYRDGE